MAFEPFEDSARQVGRRAVCALLVAVATLAVFAGGASAAVSYVEADVSPIGPAPVPVGVAVDQQDGSIHVARFFKPGLDPGEILRFDVSGNPLAPVGSGFYSGVAVAGNGDVVAFEVLHPHTSLDVFAAPASGTVPTVSFPAIGESSTSSQHIAVDGSGLVYAINQVADQIDIYDPTPDADPRLVDTIVGVGDFAMDDPSGVAVGADGSVFVADAGNSRVLKFGADGDPDPVSPIIHSGDSRSVAVDTTNGDLFVGGNDGDGFQVTVYDAAGEQVAIFGQGVILTGQVLNHGIAVDEDTKRVYVSDDLDSVVHAFDRVEIPEPDVATTAASDVTQTSATLNGTVDLGGGTAQSCIFEWGVGDAFDQQASCAELPAGTGMLAVSASISGLSPETTYKYRLVVESDGGEGSGLPAQSFTTPAHTCQTAPSMPQCDTDGDGVPNGTDQCPTVPGPTTNGGCPLPPDQDGDGLPDSEDSCPTQAGPASNNGCPVAPPSTNPPPSTDPPLVPGVKAGRLIFAAKGRQAGGRVLLKARCRGASGAKCASAVRLTVRVRSGRRARNVVIGKARLRAPVSKRARTLRVRLTKLGKRQFRSRRALRVTVSGPGVKNRRIVVVSAKRRRGR